MSSGRSGFRSALAVCAILTVVPGLRAQGARGCNAATAEPIVHVALPGNPFTPVPTSDGCWVFVALAGNAAQGGSPGVAVISRLNGTFKVERTVPLRAGGTGAVLTHDGKLLIVAAGPHVAFLDADRLKSGSGNPVLGYLDVGEGTSAIGTGQAAGAIYANVTKNDDILFVSLERATAILVVDLPKVRRGVFDQSVILGRIPTGNAPIAVTLSSDEKYLYATSQSSVPEWNWPNACAPENPQQPVYAMSRSVGAVLVVDVAKARTDAAHSVVTRFPVGCGPVRLVLTPDDRTAWVSIRADNTVMAIDTKKMLTDSAHAIVTRVKVGTAPVGVAVVDGGSRIIATNSNRFAGDANDHQPLNVIDASKGPANATLAGTIPAGAFPRELRVTADGRTLLVSNFASKTLQVVDLQRLTAVTAKPQRR